MKTKPRVPASPNNSQPAEQASGSFAAGFLLGVVTGAVGLWMSKSEHGKDLLTTLRQELQTTLDEELGDKAEPLKKAATTVVNTLSASGKKFPKFATKRVKRT